MKILLLGESSNAHWNLKKGLESLGHEVCLVSSRNWMGYKTGISLTRKSFGVWDTLKYISKLLSLLPSWRNYDVVQINNVSYFLTLKTEKSFIVYKYLRRNNKKIFMASYGSDYFWLKACVEDQIFRYSYFQCGDKKIVNSRTITEINEWLNPTRKRLNTQMAQSCNGIPTCLYEYYATYKPYYPEKTEFLPLPIDLSTVTPKSVRTDHKINFFIGIQADRSEEKGTDIMYRALERVAKKYPDKCNILKAVSIPYQQYQEMMNEADVLLDQLYSYTPGMNGLLAMAKGIVVVGGGEEENYEILGEKELRPIINVLPDEEDVYLKLEQLVLNSDQLPELSRQSIEYVKKYHDHIKVAQQYIDFWQRH